MADIKFHCPECRQRIGADETAAGLSVDCPICRSSLRIPESTTATVQVLVRRRLAVSGGMDYEGIVRRQKELAEALKEADRLRAKTAALEAELTKARAETAGAAEQSRVLNRSATEARLKLSELRNETLVVQAEMKELRQQIKTLDTGRAAATKQLAAAQLDLQNAHSANGEVSAALEQAAAIRRGCDELRVALERSQKQSPAPLSEAAGGDAARWQNAANAAEEKTALLRKELEVVGAELTELRSSHTKAEVALQEIATLRDQLIAGARERARLETRAAEANAEVLQAREEIERIKTQLKTQEIKTREIAERLQSAEQQRSGLMRRSEDQNAGQPRFKEQEFAETNAELERVRVLLSSVTLERDEARAEIAKREEALSEAAESVNQKESALRMTQTKMEALVRTVREVAAQNEADRARRAISRTAEVEQRAGVEERRRQIETELAKASELLRSAKATRFKLRERLAAGEKRQGESPESPNAETASTSEGVIELQKALEQLHPVVEAARAHFENLHAELHTMEPEEQLKKSDGVAGAESGEVQAAEPASKSGGAEGPFTGTLAG